MHSEISIWVDAPPEILFPLVADLASWPARLPHYRYVRILGPEGSGLRAAMSARRGIIPVFWEAVQTPDFAARTVHFRHVRGITRGMEVLWTLTEERGGTRAAIVHELDLRWPVIGRWFAERVIAREFIEPIAGETLRRFKALAEAGAVRQAAATAVVPVAAADAAEAPA